LQAIRPDNRDAGLSSHLPGPTGLVPAPTEAHYQLVSTGQFEPRAGGVKVVFDVEEAVADHVARTVGAAGFEVRRYYVPGHEPRRGGAAPGCVRLGAERALQEFTETEQDSVVAAFESVQGRAGFACTRIGVDSWTAGGGGGGGSSGHGNHPS
jgi:hypothetical protein